jgi:hypothetical protein
MAEKDAVRRHGFDSKLRAEADAVLADTVFRRSPVLSKLLRYLVEETAAGRANVLKSYAVAVDGLGRPENFDSAADSSARVQMVRLRKALESHYARYSPVDQQCLYLQPGSYTVRFGALAAAYPTLYRPLSLASPVPQVPSASTEESAKADPAPRQSRSYKAPVYRRTFIIGVVGFFAIAALGVVAWLQWGAPRQTQFSPVLELMPVDSGGEDRLKQTARIVTSSFADSLPRFRLSQLRMVRQGDKNGDSSPRQEVYRLFSRLEERGSQSRALYLTLEDARMQTALWSREIVLPISIEATSDALVPVAAEINGPFGVIAVHGSRRYKNSNAGGYPCLLKYFSFMRAREAGLEQKVADCFEKPVEEQRIEATILAARALFSIERSSARQDFSAAAKQGLAFARRAVASDPNDGSANYVLARLSYFQKDCVPARYYTTRAMNLNPNSPVITSNLAALAPTCAHPDADKLLDRAFLAQSPRYNNGRILLALAAISQNRVDRITEIQDSDPPQSKYNRVNYYLAEALIAAAKGHRRDAARNWRAFAKLTPPESSSPDKRLRVIVVLPDARRRLVDFLAKAGAFQEN